MFAQVDRLASEITYVGVGALRVKASLDPMGERAGGGGVRESFSLLIPIQFLRCKIGEFGIGSINNPLTDIFLYSRLLSA